MAAVAAEQPAAAEKSGRGDEHGVEDHDEGLEALDDDDDLCDAREEVEGAESDDDLVEEPTRRRKRRRVIDWDPLTKAQLHYSKHDDWSAVFWSRALPILVPARRPDGPDARAWSPGVDGARRDRGEGVRRTRAGQASEGGSRWTSGSGTTASGPVGGPVLEVSMFEMSMFVGSVSMSSTSSPAWMK